MPLAGILPQVVGVFGLELVFGNIPIIFPPMRNPHNIAHADRLARPLVAPVDVQTDFPAPKRTQRFKEGDADLLGRFLVLSLVLNIGDVEFRRNQCFVDAMYKMDRLIAGGLSSSCHHIVVYAKGDFVFAAALHVFKKPGIHATSAGSP